MSRNILSAGVQLKYIKELEVTKKAFLRRNTLHATFELRPNLLSEVYTTRLIYKTCKKDNHRHLSVYMIKPELTLYDGAKSPQHVYPNNGSLCLYFPKGNEWDGTKKIADYIVPWISEWIYFHENWLVTGTWEGGEAPHGTLHSK